MLAPTGDFVEAGPSSLNHCVMSRVMNSLEQLDAALDRLESVVDSQLARYKVERDKLSEEVRALRSSHNALQSEARTVSSRLDAAIGKLKTILES
jgi:predicted  nucleic acid-binding Zn-ribbon protein